MCIYVCVHRCFNNASEAWSLSLVLVCATWGSPSRGQTVFGPLWRRRRRHAALLDYRGAGAGVGWVEGEAELMHPVIQSFLIDQLASPQPITRPSIHLTPPLPFSCQPIHPILPRPHPFSAHPPTLTKPTTGPQPDFHPLGQAPGAGACVRACVRGFAFVFFFFFFFFVPASTQIHHQECLSSLCLHPHRTNALSIVNKPIQTTSKTSKQNKQTSLDFYCFLKTSPPI